MRYLILLFIFICTFNFCSSDPGTDTPQNEIAVKYVYPENNETDIPVNRMFIVQFDQDVYFVDFSSNITITNDDGIKIPYTFNTSYTDNPAKLFLINPSNLQSGTNYTITINKGMQSVDEKAEIKGSSTYKFITRNNNSGIDGERPGCIDEVESKLFIKLIFNEHLNPFYVITNTINDTQAVKLIDKNTSSILDCTVDYDFNSRAIVIYPTVPLQEGTTYEVQHNGELTDLAGNTVSGPGEVYYEFTL